MNELLIAEHKLSAVTGAKASQPNLYAKWAYCMNIALGAWLVTSPFTLGYRSLAMSWSDYVSGILICFFAALALSNRCAWARWSAGVVGAWLLMAPLIFWAPSAAAYANDTLVGSLVILFSIAIPSLPETSGMELPPGWSYNPSAWPQRVPIIGLALAGFFIARYLAAYQLRHFDAAWDPFFKSGTMKILDSEVSRAFPVSDAGLGALSYLLDALAGVIGNTRRWRTMPWMVIFFGILIIPSGVTSIVLVMLQPIGVGAWCTLCLVTALVMLLMVSPAVDEVIATCQFLQRARREGKSLWRTFWRGGDLEAEGEKKAAKINVGFSLPWNLVASAVLGIWLLSAPTVLQTTGAMATNYYIIGALVVTFAIIALAEVARAARWLNLLFGAWLMLAPWLIAGANAASRWNGILVGILLITLSLPRGGIKEHYGSWDRYIV